MNCGYADIKPNLLMSKSSSSLSITGVDTLKLVWSSVSDIAGGRQYTTCDIQVWGQDSRGARGYSSFRLKP